MTTIEARLTRLPSVIRAEAEIVGCNTDVGRALIRLGTLFEKYLLETDEAEFVQLLQEALMAGTTDARALDMIERQLASGRTDRATLERQHAVLNVRQGLSYAPDREAYDRSVAKVRANLFLEAR
jgi:hypothetical protein